jgi:predicted nucleic acid-binding protein
MIVADTNVTAYLLIAGDKTALAQTVWQREPQWLVPGLWRYEFLNILTTYVRSGGVTPEAALEVWEQAAALLTGAEEDPQPEQVLLLAAEHHVSAYDAQYVALAVSRKLRLLSEDRALQRKFPEIVCSLGDFCAQS